MADAIQGPPLPPRIARAHRIRHGRLSAKQFNKALSDWALTAVPSHVQQVTHWLAFETLKRVVKRTPVDTGRARGGWHVTINQPSQGGSGTKDESGGGTIEAGWANIQLAQPFQVVWISNNVDYIRILEEGGFVPLNPGPSKTGGSASKAGRKARKGKVLVENGFSVQAPEGMVAITLREMTASGVIK